MATSGENKTAGATVESTTTKSDSTSNQQAFFAKWLAKRDNAILPPKELAGNKPPKIPVLINARHPLLSKTNATVENFLPVTNEQGIHEFSDNDLNHDNNKQLLEVSNLNNCNIGDLVPERETKTEVTCTGTLQLDAVAVGDKKEIETLASANIYNYDLSLWNKQDDFNDDNFKALMKKQNELKAYYDSFPNIDDATNETSPDIKKAKEFTESILRNLPSGDVDDINTVCHVLNKLLGNGYQECLFYDSKNGINLYDASENLADMNSEDRPFVLKLKSSEGLGGITGMQTENDELELVQILINAIEQNQSHPVIEDITERLSKAYNVDKKSIVIKTVFVGTFNIVYTVLDLAINLKNSFIEISKNLKEQFKHFLSAKIHPLLFRPSFDIAYFDKRGNRTFTDENKTYQVGPPGRTHLYTQAIGWTRYGLKVLGKYTDDNWLHPFQDSENWYRAFHGTGNAQSQDFGDKKQLRDNQYASVDALSSIFETGFCPARITAYGPGVYCSPDPKFPEQGYVRPVSLNTQKGKKTFKCMLQVAVNPDGVKFTDDANIWLVPNPENIRPYGILVKKA